MTLQRTVGHCWSILGGVRYVRRREIVLRQRALLSMLMLKVCLVQQVLSSALNRLWSRIVNPIPFKKVERKSSWHFGPFWVLSLIINLEQ